MTHPLNDRVIRLREGTQAYLETYLRQPELVKKNLKLTFLGQQDGGHFDRKLNRDITAHIYPERKPSMV
jgi:hypothetical protein